MSLLLFLYSLWCLPPLRLSAPPLHRRAPTVIAHVNGYLLRFQITTANVSPRLLVRSPSGCFHDVFACLVADVSIAAMLGVMPLYPTVADDGGMFCACAIPSG